VKLILTSIFMCTLIAIIGVVAFVYIDHSSASPLLPQNQKTSQQNGNDPASSLVAKIPAKKLSEQTVNYQEFTTNLKEQGSYIIFGVSAVTDSKKSAEEAQKREFQLKNFLINELSEVTAEQASDSKIVQELIIRATAHMNQEMNEGVILEMYITNKLIN